MIGREVRRSQPDSLVRGCREAKEVALSLVAAELQQSAVLLPGLHTLRDDRESKVVRNLDEAGEQVQAGERVAVIEAMKMESAVTAGVAGTVEPGDLVVTMAPEAEAS